MADVGQETGLGLVGRLGPLQRRRQRRLRRLQPLDVGARVPQQRRRADHQHEQQQKQQRPRRGQNLIARPLGRPHHPAQQHALNVAHVHPDHPLRRGRVARLVVHVGQGQPRPQQLQLAQKRLERGDHRVRDRNRARRRVPHHGRGAQHIDLISHLDEGGLQGDGGVGAQAAVAALRLPPQPFDQRLGRARERIGLDRVRRPSLGADPEQTARTVIAQGELVAVLRGVEAAQSAVVPGDVALPHPLDRLVPDRRRRQILADDLQRARQSQLNQPLFFTGLMGVDPAADDGQHPGHAEDGRKHEDQGDPETAPRPPHGLRRNATHDAGLSRI